MHPACLGGQFLRAYTERYNDPPCHNLMYVFLLLKYDSLLKPYISTFGSQHMGVTDIPACSPRDVLCSVARRAARSGVYRKWSQENLVQAQYFRDSTRLPLYLSMNPFLPSVNGEIAAARNATYARNLAALENLVLVIFAEDITVVPKESAWFGSEAGPLDDEHELFVDGGLESVWGDAYDPEWVAGRDGGSFAEDRWVDMDDHAAPDSPLSYSAYSDFDKEGNDFDEDGDDFYVVTERDIDMDFDDMNSWETHEQSAEEEDASRALRDRVLAEIRDELARRPLGEATVAGPRQESYAMVMRVNNDRGDSFIGASQFELADVIPSEDDDNANSEDRMPSLLGLAVNPPAPVPTLSISSSSADRKPATSSAHSSPFVADRNGGAPDSPPTIIPMRMQPLYVQDWIGLRTLDERGGVHLESCAAPHMHLPDECWVWLVEKYVGGML
jgi:hypothetical protein